MKVTTGTRKQNKNTTDILLIACLIHKQVVHIDELANLKLKNQTDDYAFKHKLTRERIEIQSGYIWIHWIID